MLRTFLLRWERENLTYQFIWQPMMSERTLSVFPEGHRARNLACYCTIADDLAKISKVSRVNRAELTNRTLSGITKVSPTVTAEKMEEGKKEKSKRYL